jgi:hypothetical protein
MSEVWKSDVRCSNIKQLTLNFITSASDIGLPTKNKSSIPTLEYFTYFKLLATFTKNC